MALLRMEQREGNMDDSAILNNIEEGILRAWDYGQRLPKHCECEPCQECGGKRESIDCSHGEDDRLCEHHLCESCRRILSDMEVAEGEICFRCIPSGEGK